MASNYFYQREIPLFLNLDRVFTYLNLIGGTAFKLSFVNRSRTGKKKRPESRGAAAAAAAPLSSPLCRLFIPPGSEDPGTRDAPAAGLTFQAEGCETEPGCY